MAADHFKKVSEFTNTLMFETPGGQRYTQDSPILPNVWLAYAHDPLSQQKLILSLDHGESAGRAVQKLREMLDNYRKTKAKTFQGKPRARSEISYIPGQIAAKLYFDELMRVALPLTSWWQEMLQRLDDASDSSGAVEGAHPADWHFFPMGDQAGRCRDDLVDGLVLMRKEMSSYRSADPSLPPEQPMATARKSYIRRLPVDLIWLVRIAGLINCAVVEGKNSVLETGLAQSIAGDFKIRGLSAERPDQDDEGNKISRNEQDQIAAAQELEAEPDRVKIAENFLAIYAGWLRLGSVGKKLKTGKGKFKVEGDDRPRKAYLWRVTKNRDVHLAVNDSSLTVKADAARRLFDITCDNITWAVIDSGIDKTHPAFAVHPADVPVAGLADEGGSEPQSRVIKTLDFTNLRTLLDFDVSEGKENDTKEAYERLIRVLERRLPDGDDDVLDDKDFSPEMAGDQITDRGKRSRAIAHIAKLRRRVHKGLEIDWQHLEPLIVDHNPESPSNDHGTHVAGVLGADWIQRKGINRKLPVAQQARRIQGICPSINLIDVRVFREDGLTDEFELIAAIQFLRWMNARAGYMVVHGANMSLSLIHEVRRFACGQTPICIECNEAAALGMVIVAAAGNRGFEAEDLDHLTAEDGFRAISITDPGNAADVITVGATHRRRPHDYGVSYFSSRGPTGDGRMKPDLVAPGEKITAPVPGEAYESKDGTSMAAPHVSGAAAMLMARNPELIGKPQRIKQILCDNATDLGRDRDFQGNGMVDVLRALQSI